MMQQQKFQRGSALIFLIVFGALELSVVNSYSVNRFDDVLIKNDGENFQCDLIFCPRGSVRCQVTKSQANSTTTLRRNICYGQQGVVLLEKTISEPVKAGVRDQLNVVVTDDGYSSSSMVTSNFGEGYYGGATIDGEALQRAIQQNIRNTLDRISRNLQQNLGGFWRGFN